MWKYLILPKRAKGNLGLLEWNQWEGHRPFTYATQMLRASLEKTELGLSFHWKKYLDEKVCNLIIKIVCCSSRKYILTLVPIFVVCPALAVAAFFFRKRLMKLGQKCCDCNQNQDKDPAKVTTQVSRTQSLWAQFKTYKIYSQIESAEAEFFKMQPDQRKVSTNSYGFSPKTGEVNAIPVSFANPIWKPFESFDENWLQTRT